MKAPILSTLLILGLSIGTTLAKGNQKPEASAKIDAILAKSWKEKGLQPNAPVSDEIFVRRIYLDVAGRIPTADQVRTFLEDKSSDKRTLLIDELLNSEGYVNHAFNFWADILRVHSQQGGGRNVSPSYIRFVKDSLRDNKPYDKFVYEMITAEGDAYENGAIGYYYRDRGMPLDNMANTVRIFLGTRLECAQCHNHPFDKWSQMDFFHMAAFSYGINAQNRRSGKYEEMSREMTRDKKLSQDERRNLQRAFQEISRPLPQRSGVEYSADRLPQLPHDYQYDDAEPKDKVEARTMFGEDIEIDSPGARLHDYARWMTSKENPRFTTIISNRLWKRAMGLALVEPVDEFMDETVPANPEVLSFLDEQMKALDFDMKAFMRMLYNTDVYQRVATVEDIEVPQEYAFTGPVLRRMSAEQIWDSIVTLVNANPDLGNWRAEQEEEIRKKMADMMGEALNSRPKDQLMADVRKIAGMQKSMQQQLIELQKKQVEARKAKDQEKVRALSRESGQIRNKIRDQVYNSIYAPALKKMQGTEVALAGPSGMGMSMAKGMGKMSMKLNPKMMDKSGRPTDQVRKQLDEQEQALITAEMDDLGFTDEKLRKGYMGYRRSTMRNFARAANLSSPAQPGHFLRQFGQSDRETIENSEDAASVPQALTMLNGSTFSTLMNAYSVLSREVDKAETPEAKLDSIYLSLLNRKPEADERELILADLETRGDELYQDVAFALLNSQEFLFVK